MEDIDYSMLFTDPEVQETMAKQLGEMLTAQNYITTCMNMRQPSSPITLWLESIPKELDSEAITAVLKQHFPELFV